MNPQCGFYQNSGMNQGYGQQTYGARNNAGGMYGSSSRTMQSCRARSYNSRQNPVRAPPVFSSPSSGNFFGSPQGYPPQKQQQQQQFWNGGSVRVQQQRNAMQNGMNMQQSRGKMNNCQMKYRQQELQCQPKTQHPLAPAPYCTPQAIKVNVTAEQLENAKSTPIYQGQGEASQDGNPNVKYVQLNWNDLLGGMENLRVSMAPADPNCQNRQLKVSFGGQKTDPPEAGETPLKVVSIEPANTGRMDMQKGNALAGHMKICSTPVNLNMQNVQYAGGNGYQQTRGTCRR